MYHQPLIITGASASEVCYHALDHFVTDDPRNWQTVAPRGMTVRERLAVTYRLDNALACVAWLAKRRLNYSFMAAEFTWMVLGRRDVASIGRYCAKIKDFSDDGLTFFGAYGPPFERQLPYVVGTLQADPSSRQAVVLIWREVPPRTRDLPCTVAAQFLIRNSEVHGIFTMRSSDAWLGLPYDLFNFARLTAVVAGYLDLLPGSLTINVGSAHLYDRDRERAAQVVAANGVRAANAAPLSRLDGDVREVLGATLEGRPVPWQSKVYGTDGWYELYEMLRFRDDPNVKRLAGDFATVYDWLLSEDAVRNEEGESHGRPA